MQLIKKEEEEKNRSENEKTHMAFLGTAAIAQSAMKMVSKLSAKEKDEFLCHYQKSSFDFQTEEYIEKTAFPHDQDIIKQYLPDIHTMVNEDIIPQVVEFQRKSKE